jgi:N-acetyl-alpha-D-muramate 1-phosphate uridylyltransferase
MTGYWHEALVARQQTKMIPVAILAGGLATRLGQVSKTVPKALIPVAGEPFIAHQLRLLRRENVERVVLCVGHLGSLIQDFVGDGARFGLEVAYSEDGEKLLGTGGALRQAQPLLGEAFFVLYGDSYLDIDYTPVTAAFRGSGASALMTVFRNQGRWDTSNVLFDGIHVVRYDKRAPTPDMHYIDYGLGLLTAEVLAGRPAATAFDLADVYTALAAAGRLAGYEAKQRFYEIGTSAGLAETDAYLRERS